MREPRSTALESFPYARTVDWSDACGLGFSEVVEHGGLARWIDGYERAWRTPGTRSRKRLFASKARYVPAPFDSSLHGLAAISTFWDAEREVPTRLSRFRGSR